MSIRAVFFDVDFTLIYPGPMFRGEGYRAFCARHGMEVDEAKFERAVVSAASLLDGPEDAPYDAEIFIAYTRHIIEQMGGRGGTSTRVRARSTPSGRRASTSSCMRKSPPCSARLPGRASASG